MRNISEWMFLGMIPEDRTLQKRWYEFEAAATYEYAHEEVRATQTALTK